MTFTKAIIEDFSVQFKSVKKDCDRYFDALFDLSEKGIIEASEVLKYSSPGYVWIYFQYIEQGHIDAIEHHLLRDVTARNIYGRLHENTRLVLDRLMELCEHERVIRVYKAAISHRLSDLKSALSEYKNPNYKVDDRNSSKKWLKHYFPAFRDLVSDYEALLVKLKRIDKDVAGYQNFIISVKKSI